MALPASYSDLVILFARLIFGIIFIYYGWPKIKNLKANAKDFEGMGFKPGWLFGTGVAFLEFFGGIAVILGLYINWVSLLFAGHMTVGTLWKITKTDKAFTDWSYDLILLALALMFMSFGSGIYSL